MFGNTDPIVGIGKTFGDGIGYGPLEAYVRSEYRSADRAMVLAALRRAQGEARSGGRGWVQRIASRLRGDSRPAGHGIDRRPHGVRRPLRSAGRLDGGFPGFVLP